MSGLILWAALALAPLASGTPYPECDCCGCCVAGVCTCDDCGCCCCEGGGCEGCCDLGT